MKIISTTNGISYGDSRDELDIIPLGFGARRALSVADFAAPPTSADLLAPEDVRRLQLFAGRERDCIILIDYQRNAAIRLRWRAGEAPTAPLARIVESERAQGTPPPGWATVLLYYAARLHRHAPHSARRDAVLIALRQVRIWEQSEATRLRPSAPPPDDETIRAAALQGILAIVRGDPPPVMPESPLGRAKWTTAISRLAWDEAVGRRLREMLLTLVERNDDQLQRVLQSLTLIGAVWLHPLATPPRIAGVRLDAPPRSLGACMHLWANSLALLDATEAEARALLTPWAGREPSEAPIDEPPGAAPPATPDADLAHAMARHLAAEAVERAVYAPQGVWEVRMPAGVPLRDWGVDRVRLVVLRPQRVWAALLDAQGATIAAFPWDPGAAENWRSGGALTTPRWAWPTVDLAIAALWRDLCIAGDAVAASEDAGDAAAGAARPSPAPAPPATTPPPPSPRPLILPRAPHRGPGRAKRVCVWGTAAERDAIHRRVAALCAVRGHYRRHEYVGERSDDPRARAAAERLRRDAAARAARYGLPPPPPGYTFVAPFTRGVRSADAADVVAPRDVHAKGLAALMAVTRQDENRRQRSH